MVSSQTASHQRITPAYYSGMVGGEVARHNEGEQCSKNISFISEEETTHVTCRSNEF